MTKRNDEFTRVPPSDLEAERAVLGGMILSGEIIPEVCEILEGPEFYRPVHATIYRTILDLATRGEPVDPITLSDELRKAGELTRVGGAEYLHDLVQAVPTAANAEYYAETVREAAVRRGLIDAARRAADLAWSGEGDLDTLLDRVRDEITAATSRELSSKAERSPRLDWYEAFATDFSQVDWLPGRFMERGQQVALVGDGKVGKTLFVHEWLWRAVVGRPFLGDERRPPLRVLYFDRENSLRDIVTRMEAFGAKPADLQDAFDYRRFPKFSGGLDSAPLAVAELMAMVDESQPDIVVLDTVSRFVEGKENDSDTWLNLYRRLHVPLKDRGISGVRLDHMGKDTERGSRGSSAKSQDVDHVWEMTRTDERHQPEGDGHMVVTQIRMKRTHTRSGIGDDVLNITRRGRKGAHGLWLPGETRHELADAAGFRQHEQVIQSYVDQLLAADVPAGLGRDALKRWADSRRIALPGKNDTLAEVVRRVKEAQK